MVAEMPAVTQSLLAHIPRLEGVREILREQRTPASRRSRREIPVGSHILKVVWDYDELESSGMPSSLALDTLRHREGEYEPRVIAALTQLLGDADPRREVREIPLADVDEGMVFIEDVHTKTGALLVARGFMVTPGFLQRVRNFASDLVPGTLKVLVNMTDDEDAVLSAGTGAEGER